MDRRKFNHRPFLYKDVKKFEKDVDKYFDKCEESGKPPTMSGLAYHLNMNRRTLVLYSNRDEFSYVVERARDRVEMDMEERLLTMGTPTTGLIFSLKNNFSWTDKVEVESNNVNTNKNIDLSHLSSQEIKEMLQDED